MKKQISEILFSKKESILLIEERKRKDIVITAPHHSLGGIKYLPCPEHRDADENTGFIARHIAEKLKISSIIACNYRVDPNKSLGTDYSIQIAQWQPKFLIEIHGHGAKAISEYSIEISSGNIERSNFSEKFSKRLQSKFSKNPKLRRFKVSGEFNKIHFKAANSATIVDTRWTSIHIEIPPLLRLDIKNQLPKFGITFSSFLSDTIKEVCI